MPTPVRDAHGTEYVPWTDGYAVGFRIIPRTGPPTFLYLNPSSASDDGVSNVFLYHGPAGDPGQDGPVCYVDVAPGEPGEDRPDRDPTLDDEVRRWRSERETP